MAALSPELNKVASPYFFNEVSPVVKLERGPSDATT